ncbi:glutaredoxin family protein [Candidatus Saccharibacteria bacterium]|nr:glutaredoxin family protein [Candidatus Saccharibacteria bacterium]MCB9821632.1 glutaredoxin family protein [Candidatus Nomurabacteria bacterium]
MDTQTHKVTVFSTTYCASCAALKKWLDAKGVAYESVNLDENPDRQQEVLEKSGTLSVPVTIIADGQGVEMPPVTGPNYSAISSMLGLA